jgi:hypothetical protein
MVLSVHAIEFRSVFSPRRIVQESLTVRAQQKVSRVLPLTPLDPVDLFFNFQRFQVIEFRLMRLKLA